jgi:adenylyltransferase/sulfurtransferase
MAVRSSCHRQAVHGAPEVGRPKTESAAEAIRALNPDLNVVLHQERLTMDFRE